MIEIRPKIAHLIGNRSLAFYQRPKTIKDGNFAACTPEDARRIKKAEGIESDGSRVEVLKRRLDQEDFHSRTLEFSRFSVRLVLGQASFD
jgi:hypothetical protein